MCKEWGLVRDICCDEAFVCLHTPVYLIVLFEIQCHWALVSALGSLSLSLLLLLPSFPTLRLESGRVTMTTIPKYWLMVKSLILKVQDYIRLFLVKPQSKATFNIWLRQLATCFFTRQIAVPLVFIVPINHKSLMHNNVECHIKKSDQCIVFHVLKHTWRPPTMSTKPI